MVGTRSLGLIAWTIRATDEDARVNTQRPADEAEYHDCADPDAGPPPRDAATIFYSIACR